MHPLTIQSQGFSACLNRTDKQSERRMLLSGQPHKAGFRQFLKTPGLYQVPDWGYGQKTKKKGMGKGGAKSSISPSVRPCTHFILTVHKVKT